MDADELANHLLAETLEEFANRNSGSLEEFLGAIYYPDRASAPAPLFSFVDRHAHRLILDLLVTGISTIFLSGKLVPRDRAACGPCDRSFGFESQAKARFLQPYARKIDTPYKNL